LNFCEPDNAKLIVGRRVLFFGGVYLYQSNGPLLTGCVNIRLKVYVTIKFQNSYHGMRSHYIAVSHWLL